MSMIEMRAPLTLGEAAHDFRLPTADGKGTASLADYRGRSPVFLALLVGRWCPFCRREIARP
jgi:peroxiredoxin